MDKLKEYAAVKKQIRDLEEQESLLKEKIIGDMVETGQSKVETVWGKFSLGTRTTYRYSDKIDAMNNKLKIAKVEEEERGIAEPTQNTYLIYKS